MDKMSLLCPHESTQSILKRKVSSLLSSPEFKKIKLSPPALKEDGTIQDYRDRVSAIPNPKLILHIPLGTPLSVGTLREDLKAFQDQVSAVQCKTEDLTVELQQVRAECHQKHSDYDKKLSDYERDRSAQDLRRMFSFGATLLTRCLDKMDHKKGSAKLEGIGNNANHSTTRYSRAAEKLTEQAFIDKTHLPAKCYKLMKKYDLYVQARNQWAHDNEVDFARLLLSDNLRDSYYNQWSPYFEYCYGKTVEEVAESGQTLLEQLMIED